ncbi:hypothetical protein GCM10009525_28420 [Streptosporangium amethystogenes subsp. fukuiense]
MAHSIRLSARCAGTDGATPGSEIPPLSQGPQTSPSLSWATAPRGTPTATASIAMLAAIPTTLFFTASPYSYGRGDGLPEGVRFTRDTTGYLAKCSQMIAKCNGSRSDGTAEQATRTPQTATEATETGDPRQRAPAKGAPPAARERPGADTRGKRSGA